MEFIYLSNVSAFCWICLNSTAFNAWNMNNAMFIEELLSLHVNNSIKVHRSFEKFCTLRLRGQ